MNELLDYVLEFRINDILCDEIVGELQNSEWTSHEWYNSKEDYSYVTEKDPSQSFLESKNVEILRDVIWDSLLTYGEKNSPYKKEYVIKYSHPKFNRYSMGQGMDVHVDHTKSLFEPDRHGNRGIPVMSIVGLLNNDFTGGEFYMRDKELNLSKGSLLLFPSCFLFHHEVKKVISGIRYSFVTWGW